MTEIEILHLLISPGHDFRGRFGKGREEHEILDQESIQLVAGRGIVGDRYFDYQPDFKGQVTFFEAEVWEEVKEKFAVPDLLVSAFRRNIVVRGVDLNQLIGQEFEVGEIRFSGSEEAKPCFWMNEACAPGVEDFLKGRGGLRCRIHTDGTLKRGKTLLQK